MTETAKIKAKVLRDFNDAGTETNHLKDQELSLSAGEFQNLKLAGLVEEVAEAQPTGGKAKPATATA